LAPEEYLLAIILEQPGTLSVANNELTSLGLAPLSADDFQQVENRQLFLTLSDWVATKYPQGAQYPSPEDQDASQLEGLVQQTDPLLRPRLGFLRERWNTLPAAPPEMLEKDLVSRILTLRDQHLQEEISNLRFLQRDAEESHDEEQRLHYQTLVNAAKEKLRLVQQATGRRSIMGRRRAEAEQFGLVNI
jgi:hypothetical protein